MMGRWGSAADGLAEWLGCGVDGYGYYGSVPGDCTGADAGWEMCAPGQRLRWVDSGYLKGWLCASC